MKRIIFILIVELIIFVNASRKVWATASNLRCVPSVGTFNVGDTFNVDYELDTRSFTTYGADVVATFDPYIIEAVGNQSNPVTFATSWSQPTTNSIDNSLGKIDLIYEKDQPEYNGVATIGQVTFKAKASGQTQFNFTFFQQNDDTTPGVAKVWGKRDGVNITNILTDVNNCIFVVEAAGTTPGASLGEPIPTLIPPVTTPTTVAPTLPIGQPILASVTPQVNPEVPVAGSTENIIYLLTISTLFLTFGTIVGSLVFFYENNPTD